MYRLFILSAAILLLAAVVPAAVLIASQGRLTYEQCLNSTLLLPYAAAAYLAGLVFAPRFSPLTLANVLLLSTAFLPTATDALTLGTQVGFWLWVANCGCSGALFWRSKNTRWDGEAVFVSLSGTAAFGLHVLMFSACP
jgi:hypothetical protein